MLNGNLPLLCRHTVGLIKLNCLCPHPYLTKTKKIWLGTKPVRDVQWIPSNRACVMNGWLYFLPSMTFRLGIIQLLCESPGNLPLTVHRPVGSRLLSEPSQKNGVGPSAGVCCPISLSAEAFLSLAHLSDVQVCLGSAYSLESGSWLPGWRSFPPGIEAFIKLNNNLLPPGAHRGRWIGFLLPCIWKPRASAPAWIVLLHVLWGIRARRLLVQLRVTG